MWIVPLMLLLAVMGIYAVFNLLDIYLIFDTWLVKFGVIVLFVMSLIIITRYLFLILFSMLKTIQKSSDAKQGGLYDHSEHRVSIIVPAFNEENVIVSSVSSLMRQSYRNLEIIVVDDGSKDRTYKRAKSLEFEGSERSLRVLSKPNGGKARAINFGMEHATGDLIMVVDADSALSINAVELMVPYFDDAEVAAVAGSVYVSNRDNTLTRLQALEYIEGLNMVRNGQAFLKLVNIVPGPIGVFRKEAVMAVGGYDSDTFAEDCDLTLKLIERGHKIEFEPDALAITEAPEQLLDLIKQRYRWTRGILQSIRKHSGYLWRPRQNRSMSFVLWYMLFESIFWPFFDVWGNLFFLYLAVKSGASSFIFYWWILYTVMDIAGALYCLMITREPLHLAWYAVLYRLYFITVINISKIFATMEEWLQLDMTWGKLDRKGKI
ncbi:MAG: glycosyltransferase family 2 protein [Campylobacterales bacterium]|nr:glycosyltransferase family 2 protein [Campylobacterales bacterium]